MRLSICFYLKQIFIQQLSSIHLYTLSLVSFKLTFYNPTIMKRLLLFVVTLGVAMPLFAQTAQKAYLGIHYNHVNESKLEKLGYDNKNGLQITQVVQNSGASKAGLKPFDYVYGIDNYEFNDTMTLGRALKNYYKPGDNVAIKFYRQGKKQTSKTTLGTKSDGETVKKQQFEKPFFGITPSHAKKPKEMEGQVVKIIENTTAEQMGLNDDDMITKINDIPIYDWHDISTSINNLFAGDDIKVTWINDGVEKTETMPIGNHSGAFQDYKVFVTENEEVKEMPKEEAMEIKEADDIVQVAFQNVTEEEAEDMKDDMGIDMPVINNLQIEQLTVFPNPTQGRFNVKFDLPNSGETIIQIYNSAGQVVYNRNLGDYTGQFNDQLDISNNARGLYFVMISQGTTSISRKLILQ